MPIGERLRAERERLGLSQTEFGQSAGVGRKSQFNYEADERLPDAAYLAAVAGLGVDVRYVITGQRDYAPPPPLSAEERALLDAWRAASYETRRAAMGALVGASTRGAYRSAGATQSQSQAVHSPAPPPYRNKKGGG